MSVSPLRPGITLLEALVALGILAMGALDALAGLAQSRAGASRATKAVVEAAVAENACAHIRLGLTDLRVSLDTAETATSTQVTEPVDDQCSPFP